MIAMFFNILVVYIICSFIVLIALVLGKIKMYDRETREELEIVPLTQVALSIFWPVLLYIMFKCLQDNIERK